MMCPWKVHILVVTGRTGDLQVPPLGLGLRVGHGGHGPDSNLKLDFRLPVASPKLELLVVHTAVVALRLTLPVAGLRLGALPWPAPVVFLVGPALPPAAPVVLLTRLAVAVAWAA